jgi:predicted DNA-binding transcriptional regulator AlpA
MTKKKRTAKVAALLSSDAAPTRGTLTEIEHTANIASHVSGAVPIPPGDIELISGPKLRAKLGISAVTLWRWRHDEEGGFPAAKVIKGRLYFPLGDVEAWLAKQPEAA